MADASETPLREHHNWTVKLSDTWDVGIPVLRVVRLTSANIKVLGPFPIYAREQHFLSPSFPLRCESHLNSVCFN